MGKRNLFILNLLFLFFAHTSLVAQLSCPLSAPQNVHITGVTPTSLFVEWNSVPGAASYKISVYDDTDMVALPDVFSNVPSVELADLATATHEYTIRVSASACANGPYGGATSAKYKPGIIIIVDVVVERANNPTFGTPTTPGSSQLLTFATNPNSSGYITTNHIKVRDTISEAYAEFLIWKDCYGQIRYHKIETEGTTGTPLGTSIPYKMDGVGGANFFVIANEECGQGTGYCTKIYYSNPRNYKVYQNEWILENDLSTCGPARPEGSRSQKDTPNPAETAYGRNLKSSTNSPLTMDKNGIPAPENVSLKAIPNPFSDLIQIQYEVKTLQQVRIDLMNSTGMLVENVLPLEWTDKGSYQKTLPVDPRLPSGLYFLVMQTGTDRQVIPMIKE